MFAKDCSARLRNFSSSPVHKKMLPVPEDLQECMQDEGADDFPMITDVQLKSSPAFSTVYRALLKDELHTIPADVFPTCIQNIVQSSDDRRVEILDYFIQSGVPFKYSQDKVPTAVIVAKQPNHYGQYMMLLCLKFLDSESLFLVDSSTNENAWQILTRTNPALCAAIEHGSYLNRED